ncbi:MAG TPA: hypothetical protein LFW20_06655 [Rickettsia endosymbiont of Omalisus fontisbellaquei]|nr:hypothetical protein [Rickettsia endosymbiont of Omalisus fontisbellaquei]
MDTVVKPRYDTECGNLAIIKIQ